MYVKLLQDTNKWARDNENRPSGEHFFSIFGPKAAKRYLLIKSGFFQDEVKKIGPPLFVDARLRENLF